jgi:hypothetical protein
MLIRLDDFIEEIDYLENSFIDIEDEFNLNQIEFNDERIKKPYNFTLYENAYYTSYYKDSYGDLCFNIKIFLVIEDIQQDELWSPKNKINEKYEGFVNSIENFNNQSKFILESMDNQVKTEISYGFQRALTNDTYPRTTGSIATISLFYTIKTNESIRIEKNKSVERMIKSVGGWSKEDLKKFKDLGYNISESSDKEKLDLYNKLKSEIMDLKRELKLYYFEYNINDIIYDEISKENPNMEVIDEIKNNFNYTKDEIDKLELIIEDNNDMNKDITTDLFCIKPFGDYSMIFYDDGVRRHHKLEDGKLKRVDLNLEVDPSEYSAYFGIEIEFATEFDGSLYNKMILLPEMKSIFKLITLLESDYYIIRMILSGNGDKLYIYFKTK